MYSYKTRGTCSQQILFDVEDGCLHNVRFVGGCAGNTQGLSRLVEGMRIDDVIARLKGIQCRSGTSCPDQLAMALEKYRLRQV